MTEQSRGFFTCRIRAKGGALDGKWLWTMSATKGAVPTQVTNWPNVVRHANQYQFAPQFIDKEESATRTTREVAEAYLVALKTLGIDAEIMEI